jgi:hypothetical protein
LDLTCKMVDHDDLLSREVVMRNLQELRSVDVAPMELSRALSEGRAVALDSGGGRLSIVSGQVWLTRPGDPEDHFLGAGESLRIPAAQGTAIIEAWRGQGPASFAWQPASWMDRLRERARRAYGRCWELVDPAARIAVGTLAALLALGAAGLLFGPVADARTRSLARPLAGITVLHNAGSVDPDASVTRRTFADGSDTRDRSRVAPHEARRGPASAA